MKSFSIIVIILFFSSIVVQSCNEYVCGSVVSKCSLTRSCDCQLSDCYCCKDCINCLGKLFIECCSCLKMCPTQNVTESALSPKSELGDFDGIPELFDTLTDVVDDKWTIYRFSIKSNSNLKFDAISRLRDDIDRDAMEIKNPLQVPDANCTVIFLNTCTSSKKCTQYCESVGAKSYRWFHDGCCECVGANCSNYGINESKCQNCPEQNEEEEEEGMDPFEEDYENDDLWDYGEEELNYN